MNKTKYEMTSENSGMASENLGMTNEEIVMIVIADMNGTKPLSAQDRSKMQQLMYDCIHKLVFKLASKYAVSCHEESEDLAQDCMVRIISQLWRYDPKMAKFTTWTWYVCRSILNNKYNNSKDTREFICDPRTYTGENGESLLENMPEIPISDKRNYDCPGILGNDIVDAVRKLVQQYPAHKAFILEMFGNPDSENFILPNYVSVSETAKAIGMDYSKARTLYGKIIKPFFERQFVGC